MLIPYASRRCLHIPWQHFQVARTNARNIRLFLLEGPGGSSLNITTCHHQVLLKPSVSRTTMCKFLAVGSFLFCFNPPEAQTKQTSASFTLEQAGQGLTGIFYMDMHMYMHKQIYYTYTICEKSKVGNPASGSGGWIESLGCAHPTPWLKIPLDHHIGVPTRERHLGVS